jgi:Tfp pilus assembly protein PilV
MHDVKKTFRLSAGLQGFSLLEVMIAGTVLIFAITTSLTVMQRGFLSLDTARNLTIAGQILQCEMEKLRMRDWTAVSAYDFDPATPPDAVALDASFTSNASIGSRFKLYRDVANITTTTGLGMRQVTYTVTWNSYDGRPLSRSYTTYYGQNGLYDYFYNSI